MIVLWILSTLAACGSNPSRIDDPWARGMAGALALRALDQMAAGERDRARDSAQQAARMAERSQDSRSLGLALSVLGDLDRDPEQLARARDLLARVAPGPETWQVRLTLADVLLDAGRLEDALHELDPVVEAAEASPEPAIRAENEATARHLRAVALRRLGRLEAARADDRRAALVLTLAPDSSLPALRLVLFQVLGDDLLELGDPAGAYARHTRARSLAREQGDREAETRALSSQAHDLAALGRFADAGDRAVLASEHALALGDLPQARRLALAGLGWFDDAGYAIDSPRRQPLLDVLSELDDAAD